MKYWALSFVVWSGCQGGCLKSYLPRKLACMPETRMERFSHRDQAHKAAAGVVCSEQSVKLEFCRGLRCWPVEARCLSVPSIGG